MPRTQPPTSWFSTSWSTVAMAVGVTIVLATIITVAPEPAGPGSASGSRRQIAYGFALGFGAILLLRRKLPVAVLVLSVLATFAYYTLGLATLGVAVPVVAALFCAAEAGRIRWAIGAGIVVFAVALAFRLRDDPQPVGILLGHDAITNLGLIAAAIALGYGVRASRLQRTQQAQITTLTEERSALDAQARIETERARLSRELHDTIGHSLSVISLHAGVTAEAIGHDDEVATQALDRVRQECSTSLHELRSLVRVLRTTDDGDHSLQVRSLHEIPDLADQLRSAGITVNVDLNASADTLPAPVNAAAFRVAQESVTNVLRHAAPTTVTITTVVRDGLLQVTVADDGSGRDPGSTNGFGLTGMAERVRLLGGTVRTQDRSDGGFVVHAEIPVRLPS